MAGQRKCTSLFSSHVTPFRFALFLHSFSVLA